MDVLPVINELDRKAGPGDTPPAIDGINRGDDPAHGDAGDDRIAGSHGASRLRVLDGGDASSVRNGADETRKDMTNVETRAEPWSHERSLKLIAVGYWSLFWLLNGLDKFLNRTDLGVFVWYGKDRTAQFTEYFQRLDVPVHFIDPVLYFAGVWEILVAAPLFAALVLLCRHGQSARLDSAVGWGFVLSGITLIAFSAFDVVAGDRAELREHGLYLVVLLVCYLLTRTAGIGARHGRARTEQTGARPNARWSTDPATARS